MENKKAIFRDVKLVQDQDYINNGIQYVLYGGELISTFQDRQIFLEGGETKFSSSIRLKNSTITLPEGIIRLNKGCFTNLPTAIDNVIVSNHCSIEQGVNIGRPSTDPLTLTFTDKIHNVKYNTANGVYETVKSGQVQFEMDGSAIGNTGMNAETAGMDKNLKFFVAHQVNLQTIGQEQ